MKIHSNFKRGFFFTVMALAILSFMLLTVQVWTRTFEQSDIHSAERFKGEAMRLVFVTISDETFSKFANASAFYATYKLVNYTMLPQHSLVNLTSSDSNNVNTGEVERVIKELIANGSTIPDTGPSPIPLVYTLQENDSYTFASWKQKILQAANLMGFTTSFSDMNDFSYKQIDPWTIGVSFSVAMTISDLEGTMHQSKILHANSTFSIVGFVDPSITRNELERRGLNDTDLVAQKQIWKHFAYNTSSDLIPTQFNFNPTLYEEGVGWFYGPIVSNYPPNMSQDEQTLYLPRLSQTILVHDWDSELSSRSSEFGAIIVTTEPNLTTTEINDGTYNYNLTVQGQCLNCLRWCTGSNLPLDCPDATNPERFSNNVSIPFIAVSGTSFYGNLNTVPNITNDAVFPNGKFLLFDNEHENGPLYADKQNGYHRIWDITKIRDMSVCGFYVQNSGPSFFQRMLTASESINNSVLGIETFVIGQWAGGASDTSFNNVANTYSRLDWEFYQQTVGSRIKGMSGCKDSYMCSNNTNVTNLGIGRFKLTPDAISRYGLDKIICPEDISGHTGAKCGSPEQ